MKKESEKLLNEIYVTTDDQEIKDKVLQILRIEQSQAKGKFDYYKYVCKDELRPLMTGVYHDNGFKVASDCHILVAIKDDYDESELGGRVLKKDGTILTDGIYPNWRAVIPELSNGKYQKKSETVKINFTKWDEIMATWKAEKKVGDEKKAVKVGNAYYKVELFNLLVLALKKLGVDEFINTWNLRCGHTVDEARPAAGFIRTSDGSVALLMPFRVENDEYYEL
jgi:hypothetical protein